MGLISLLEKGSAKWEVRKRMIPFQRERKRVRNSLNKRGRENKIDVLDGWYARGFGCRGGYKKIIF